MMPEYPWQGYSIPEPGAWARKVVPRPLETLYEVAAQTGFSVRWIRALVRRYGIEVVYVRRHIRMCDGTIRVRYAAALPQGAGNLILICHVAESTKRALRIYRARLGRPGREPWRRHRRTGTW